MGNHQHLRYKLLQNFRSYCNSREQRHCVSINDVQYRPHNETWHHAFIKNRNFSNSGFIGISYGWHDSCQQLLIFYGRYMDSNLAFIVVYGILFGLFAGMTFMLPLIECNKYFPGKRMFVNGFVLIGTGLGSAIFGQFTYNYINPEKIPSNLGYYDGNLEYIALRTPSCIRFLSLIYICLGLTASLLLRPVIMHNARKNEVVNSSSSSTNQGG